MNKKRVLIIHGWGNHRPEGHWQRRLATALRQQGHIVAYPQLPNTDLPNLDDWLEVVSTELAMLDEVGQGDLVVVCHSLGCLTWLNVALRGLAPKDVSRVLLVAPADPELCGEVSTFTAALSSPNLKTAVQNAATVTLLIASDNDPWLPRGVKETFATPLDIPSVVIAGAGHLSLDDEPQWGPWQGVIDWVNDPSASLKTR